MNVDLLILAIGSFLLLAAVASAGLTVWHFSEVPLKPRVGCPETNYSGGTPRDVGLRYLNVRLPGFWGDYPAWLVPSGDEKRWAIMIHGRGGDRTSWLGTLPMLSERGITSLSITMLNDRGAPSPPDGLDHLGLDEWPAVQDAVLFARSRGATEILLFGRSAGAMVAMQFLRHSVEDHLVTGLVFDDPVLDWKPVFLNCRPKWMPEWVGNLILKVSISRIRARWEYLRLVDSPPLHRPPMLIMHSVKDEVVPYGISAEFAFKTDWPVQLTYTRGRHGQAREWDPDIHDELIKSWLEHHYQGAS